ncbi:MAG: hypothetical protein O3C57_00965 [Verrucomicrobia bacterium]|nr:hypothetical protein [Verrucomicrobiota bacterium]
MLTWFNEVNRLVHWLLGYPSGSRETMLIWTVSIFALLVSMRCACYVYRISNVDWLRLITALLIGIYGLLGASALTSLYVLGHLSGAMSRQIAHFALPILAYLVIGIPMQCAFLKTTFVKVFLAFTSSVLVTILAINITHYAAGSMGAGKHRSQDLRSRSNNFQKVINE